MDSQLALFEKIKQHLLTQSNKIGKKIETETALAEHFGVSRYKIRQALTALTQMGYLDRVPKKGSVVRRPNTDVLSDQIKFQFAVAGFNAAEFIEARILIETAILPLAVRRMTPSLMTQLEYALEQIEANADKPLEADKHDRNFHLLLLQACGNRVLQTFSGVLITYFEKTTSLLAACDRNYFIDIAEKEREILQAIKDDNPELAEHLLKTHLIEKAALPTTHT